MVAAAEEEPLCDVYKVRADCRESAGRGRGGGGGRAGRQRESLGREVAEPMKWDCRAGTASVWQLVTAEVAGRRRLR